MSDFTFETSDHRAIPLWKLVITWPLVLVLLKCAGAGFISTQDSSAGGFLTQAGTPGNELAAKIFGYATEIILLAILLPLSRRIATEFRANYLVTATFGLALASIAWSQDSLMTLRALYWLTLSISLVFWMSIKLPLARQMQLLMITGTAAGLISILVVVLVPTVGLDRLTTMCGRGFSRQRTTWAAYSYICLRQPFTTKRKRSPPAGLRSSI